MKNFLYSLAALFMGAAMFTSCSNDDDETVATLTFEGEYFTKLIDNPQYGGELIYSDKEYKWNDAATLLSSNCEKEYWSAWGSGFGWKNGIAVSNYVDNDEAANYKKQLSVPAGNGSQNFAVVWDDGSALTFGDGQARRVQSMMVSPTTYCLNNVMKAAGEGYEFKAVATGMRGGQATGTVDIVMAKGTDVKKAWFTVDMSKLGAVESIVFTFEGTDKSSYGGLATPKYIALDNVVVVK